MRKRVLGLIAVGVTALMTSCAVSLPVAVSEVGVGSKTGKSAIFL